MSQIDVNSLLSQMRQMSTQASASTSESAFRSIGASQGTSLAGSSFGDLLKQSIADVAQNQTQAGTLAANFERGAPGADLASTMVSIQKAQLSLSAMNQVRNKLVEAYKDVMGMSI
ncbi:flagellar hook-basal body complex protein FliE [Dyella sp. A6]|uniref:flagellar hook-basal body complex protein FliE n=1 Tax=Dyella aluminiiresistens TaxID=3069105 RepID=UPI002E763EE5|nr:flagellar hook-basal body complex protein FliE [Dyella sp. A6]